MAVPLVARFFEYGSYGSTGRGAATPTLGSSASSRRSAPVGLHRGADAGSLRDGVRRELLLPGLQEGGAHVCTGAFVCRRCIRSSA